MDINKLKESPHRRKNILTGEWVLVSPHRTQRPWQGKVEDVVNLKRPDYDPQCYLCPGNSRAGGITNPRYENQFVFLNDFSALYPDVRQVNLNESDLLVTETESGICKVVCFSPRHDLTLAEMEIYDIEKVISTWQKEYNELGSIPNINYVQIFENKGEIMGCSNPHPHGQIWAQKSIPVEPYKETKCFLEHLNGKGKCLLCDYLNIELKAEDRIVAENEDFVVLVPFWAVWPFETIIISKRHFGSLSELKDQEKKSFAEIIKLITTKYDNIFSVSFPYSAGIHQSPTDDIKHPEWHFHMHFYPPLLRSASIKKFMVGYEMLANPQRDITAESSTDLLRNLSNVHYLKDSLQNN